MKRFIGERMTVPLTPAVHSGNFLFLSGQVPTRPDGSNPRRDPRRRRSSCLKSSPLWQGGRFELRDVVKTTVFLRDMKDFDAMNAVYAVFPENPPARSCVRAEVAIAADVEIEAIAMKNA